ncbi:MAG: hypothetical protein JRJ14_04920 [Deltaproteobacteria bacterium]|nr:hypothetical protein [Deltaproteobacteria bacterium]
MKVIWIASYPRCCNALLVRYEEMTSNLPKVLHDLGGFLDRDIKSAQIPDRDSISGVDGRWVRAKRDKQFSMSEDMLELFYQLNEGSMREMGYLA